MLLAGSTGVLGSGFVDALRGTGERVVRMVLPWGESGAVASTISDYWRAAEGLAGAEPITLIWAAGVGTVGAPPAAMAAESTTLRAVVAALAGSTRGDQRDCLLFASSAGAVYGGHGPGSIEEGSAPSPITAYGYEKLAQEALVSRLATAGAMRTLTCRFTNVFGLADGRLKTKGMVSALIHSALLRQPTHLFVSPDTRRDYVFNADAARMALAEASAPRSEASRSSLVRSGTTMAVTELVTSVSRVLRRRVPVVFVASPEEAVQPRVLHFPPRRGPQAQVRTTTFEAAVRLMTQAPASVIDAAIWGA